MIRPPLKIKLTEGCMAYDLEVNGTSTLKLSDADLRECLRVVIENADHPTLCSILQEAVREMGTYDTDGKRCEQCGDMVETYTLEFK